VGISTWRFDLRSRGVKRGNAAKVWQAPASSVKAGTLIRAHLSRRSLIGTLDLAALSAWYQCVGALRMAVASWQAKGSKHAAVAIPLQAQLLCLSRDQEFLKDVNGLMDNLQKQLRVDSRPSTVWRIFKRCGNVRHVSCGAQACDCAPWGTMSAALSSACREAAA